MIQQKTLSVSVPGYLPDWATFNKERTGFSVRLRFKFSKNSRFSQQLSNAAVRIVYILSMPLTLTSELLISLIYITDYLEYSQKSSLYCSIFFIIMTLCSLFLIIRKKRRNLTGTLILIISMILILFFRNNHHPSYKNGEVVKSQKTRNSVRTVFYISEYKSKAVCYPYSLPEQGNIVSYKRISKILPDSPYNLHLLREGIRYTAYCSIPEKNIINNNSIAHIQNGVRKRILDCFGRTEYWPLLQALFLADKNGIPKHDLLLFRRAGLLHLLAASGMHVGIIAGGIFLVFGSIIRNRGKLLVLVSLILLLYLFLTGFPVSLSRACIMFWIAAFCRIVHIRTEAFNILLLTAVLILAVTPSQLFNAGFQLSFLATAGIILFYRQIRRSLPVLPVKIHELAAVSLAAQMMIIPLLYYTFGEVNAAGLLSGIICLPVFSVFCNISLITLIIPLHLLLLRKWAVFICSSLYTLFIKTAGITAGLPLHIHGNSLIPVIFFFILLIIIFFISGPGKKLTALLVYPLIFSAYFTFFVSPRQIHRNVFIKQNEMYIHGPVEYRDTRLIENIVINRYPDRISVIADNDFFRCQKEYTSVIKALPVNRIIITTAKRRRFSRKLWYLIKEEDITIIHDPGFTAEMSVPDYREKPETE